MLKRARLLALFLLAACGSDAVATPAPVTTPPTETPAPTPTTTATTDAPPPPPPPPPPEEPLARMMLLRTVRWPSGGRETTVGILDQKTAKPFAEDLSARIVMTPPDGIKGTAKARKVSLDPGYTAILLPPDQTTTDRATLAQAILAFVAGRPPTEGIALYRHGSGIQLFSNFQEDRSELKEALDRYKSGTSDATPLASAIAIATLVTELKDVGGSGPDVMRTLVVLAKDPKTIDTAPTDVFVTAVTPDATGLGAAAAAIDDLRKNAFYKVGVCSVEDKVAVSFKVDKMKGSLPASLPPTLPEEKGGTCSVDAIDSMKRAFTPRIELVFDDDQRAAHAVRVQATQAGTFDEVLAKSDFQTGVRLAPGQPVQTARAHLHGQSSLRCARKHYVLQLDGPARHLMPDSATDEFILISLCDDPAYVYSPTAYTLMRPDLFVPRRRFVELVIDGTTRGIYMLMEKPREEMVRDSTRVSTVMRRGYPVAGADAFDVNYPNTGDLTLPVQRYNAFKATFMGLSGAALVAALRNQMDLDQYVRFLASQSILQSGDYIDELYYIGAEQADGKGGTHERYRFMMWDAEGYSACHAGGANAWVDPDQLAYCAEAEIDKKILPDPAVYKLFVAQMEIQLAGQLRRERMAAELDATRTQLQALLVDPAICAAMTELLTFNAGAADCAVARTVIGNRATALLAAYDARRAFLLDRIAAYKAKP